ncbi:MAG: PfkB family carbohydrate kinase, partial [Clostridia bacterium]|nr:PfkB family carbohydrate kinase [Clostridia bacterium]
GDMRLAINDMAITQRLTPEALQPKIEKLNRSSAVVLDANLPPRTIEWLGEQLTVPIIADAVSAAKVERLVPILDRLDAFKPNRIEAEMLTGITINDETGARLAAEELVARGVRRVFLTLGDKGVCIADKDCNRFVKPVPVNLINATGAGDAFTAALVWATLRGCDLTETVAAGMAASSVAVESTLTVSPNMSAELLIERMNKILEVIR